MSTTTTMAINTFSPIPNLAYSTAVCFNCYRSPPQTSNLSKCSSCLRVKYCSTECSKSDWKSHKSFCKTFKVVRERSKALLPPLVNTLEGIEIRKQVQQFQLFEEVELLEVGLNRELEKLEMLLHYRENRCWICWDREIECKERGEEFKQCTGCKIACFCADHEEAGKKLHRETVLKDGRTQCQLYNLSSEILEFHLRHTSSTSLPPSLFIPSRIITSPITPTATTTDSTTSTSKPEPTNWIDYFLSVDLPTPTPSNAEVFGIFAESLSPVITILNYIKRFKIKPNLKGNLRIELIGATTLYEGSFLPCFEEILHQLPNLNSISLVFIGEEVPLTLEATHTEIHLATCPKCTQSERKVGFEWRNGIYHELVEAGELEVEVNLAVIFDAGELDDETNNWKKTIQNLQSRKIPILFSSNTKEEAKSNLSFLVNLQSGENNSTDSSCWIIERNSWCGGDVNVDVFEEGGFWRRNEFLVFKE